MRKGVALIIIGILVLISAWFLFKTFSQENIIGGETDEHGCLGPAGYTWSQDVQACLRNWELNENQKKAAKIAVKEVGYEKGLTILQVDVARCLGCFIVTIQRDGGQIKIVLNNWTFQEQMEFLDPLTCGDLGGRCLNIVAGDDCYENETNVGKVVGFISPNICCVPFE